jgi:hypothetical protein
MRGNERGRKAGRGRGIGPEDALELVVTIEKETVHCGAVEWRRGAAKHNDKINSEGLLWKAIREIKETEKVKGIGRGGIEGGVGDRKVKMCMGLDIAKDL